MPVQRPISPIPSTQWGRAFIGRRRGLLIETAQSALIVILKLAIGGLTSVILIVLSTGSLQFQGQFVPISLRLVLKLWQLMPWLQGGHHAVNFSTWWEFQYP